MEQQLDKTFYETHYLIIYHSHTYVTLVIDADYVCKTCMYQYKY